MLKSKGASWVLTCSEESCPLPITHYHINTTTISLYQLELMVESLNWQHFHLIYVPLSRTPNKLYFYETIQIDNLFEETNLKMCCATVGCRSKYVLTDMHTKRLGGAIKLTYTCNKFYTIAMFNSSSTSKYRQNIIMRSVVLALVCAGLPYSKYYSIVAMSLGMKAHLLPIIGNCWKSCTVIHTVFLMNIVMKQS